MWNFVTLQFWIVGNRVIGKFFDFGILWISLKNYSIGNDKNSVVFFAKMSKIYIHLYKNIGNFCDFGILWISLKNYSIGFDKNKVVYCENVKNLHRFIRKYKLEYF